MTCSTFAFDWDTGTGDFFDGEITVRGLTFTVTAATNASVFASATINCTGACTVASAVALPQVTAGGDFSTSAALTLARLIAPAQDLIFFHGANFTLTAYTAGDWDACNITSDDASTWGFVNPAAMVVVGINVQDSNASNAIDATDTCTDGTGNTNWTFE